MVGGEAQLELAAVQLLIFVFVSTDKFAHFFAILHHPGDGSHEFPGVVHVKACREIVGVGTLGKHDEGARGGSRTQGPDAVAPEVHGHLVGDIAAESVDTDAVHPVAHGVDHRFAHLLVLVVQVGDIGPVGARREDDVAGSVMRVPVGVLGDPLVVPCRVVGYPVQDDPHVALVAFLDQLAQVIDRAILGRHGLVVLDGVR